MNEMVFATPQNY